MVWLCDPRDGYCGVDDWYEETCEEHNTGYDDDDCCDDCDKDDDDDDNDDDMMDVDFEDMLDDDMMDVDLEDMLDGFNQFIDNYQETIDMLPEDS